MEESSWRRGWNDTKHGWGDWRFLLLEALVSPVVGAAVGIIFGSGWGVVAAIGVVTVGLVSVWIGATSHAPYAQRNEARRALRELHSGFPDIDIGFSTLATETRTKDSLVFGLLRINSARITNRSNTNVSLSFQAWAYMDKGMERYPKGLPSSRWHSWVLVAGDVPEAQAELSELVNIPAKSSVQGNLTFIVPRWSKEADRDFSKDLLIYRSSVRLVEHVSGTSRDFPLIN